MSELLDQKVHEYQLILERKDELADLTKENNAAKEALEQEICQMMVDEENVGDLDTAQIIKANMTIRGRWSESPTYTGVTAYLDKLVVRIYEEEGSLDDLKEGIMD